MIKSLIFCCLLFIGGLANAQNFSINPGITGAWADPTTPGQGFMIDVLADRQELFVGWFTYDKGKTAATSSSDYPDHRWFTAQGRYDENSADLTIYVSENGHRFSELPATTMAIGTLSLRFTDCDTAQVSYTITNPDVSNSFTINKLARSTLCHQIAGELP